MSILQEYQTIREELGEEEYQGIIEYLNIYKNLYLSDIYYNQSNYIKFKQWFNAINKIVK